jgi:phosphate/sulfate permease
MMLQKEAEDWFNITSYIIQSFIGTPIMGIVTSAIVAFFVKSKVQVQ